MEMQALCVKRKGSATGRAVEGSVGDGFSAVPGCSRYSGGRAARAGEPRCIRLQQVAPGCNALCLRGGNLREENNFAQLVHLRIHELGADCLDDPSLNLKSRNPQRR